MQAVGPIMLTSVAPARTSSPLQAVDTLLVKLDQAIDRLEQEREQATLREEDADSGDEKGGRKGHKAPSADEMKV